MYNFLMNSNIDEENKENNTTNIFRAILFYGVINLTGIVVLPTLEILAPYLFHVLLYTVLQTLFIW